MVNVRICGSNLFQKAGFTDLIWPMFSHTFILSFSQNSFVALQKKKKKKFNQSFGTKASKQEKKKLPSPFIVLIFWKYLPCSSCSPSYLLSLSMHRQKHLACDSLHLKPTGKPMSERVWPLSLLHVHRILESDKQSQNLRHRVLRQVCALRLLIQPRKVFTRSALLRAPGMMFV